MSTPSRILVWLFAIAFCLFYFYLFIIFGTFQLTNNPQAMDFLAVYTGGQLISLSPTHLYTLHLQQTLQHTIDPITKSRGIFLPFLNPPFIAMSTQLIVGFGVLDAYALFLGFNILMLVVICFVFFKQNKNIPAVYKAAFILNIIAFIPILITLLVGQWSIVLCVVFLLSWLFLKKGWDFPSGLIISLLLIKPQFFLLPLFAMLIQRRWKVTAGVLTGMALLIGVSYLSIGATGMNKYFRLLASLYQSGLGYNINLMAQQSLQTLLLLIFHTQALDQVRIFWIIAILAIGIPTLYIWSKKFSVNSPEFSFHWALLIVATLLISPHTHFYDISLLLAVTLFLLTQINKATRRLKKLIITFSVLNFCIPWFGYWLFLLTPDAMQGLWVIPTIVYLIIFWIFLYKELVSSRKISKPKSEAD